MRNTFGLHDDSVDMARNDANARSHTMVMWLGSPSLRLPAMSQLDCALDSADSVNTEADL